MSKPFAPVDAPYPGMTGLSRLRSLIGRSSCPPRPADEHLLAWHQASGSSLSFQEWCDPAVRDLAAAAISVDRSRIDAPEEAHDPDGLAVAVVEFAQARAGADYPADSIAADIVALLDTVDTVSQAGGTSRDLGGEDDHERCREAVRLVARGLTAWASAQVDMVSVGACTDPVTGLVTGGFLRARVRELHAQCDALAIAPPVTFGSLVVQLDGSTSPLTERMAARVVVSRILTTLFTAGETVATIGASRFVAVMPAYALGQAESDLTEALTGRSGLGEPGMPVRISREAFAAHAEATWRSLAGIRAEA